MAVYFFHLRNHIDRLIDPDGRELTVAAIPAAALGEARAIISADARTGRVEMDQAIEVEDSSGTVVHRIAFKDAVEIVPAR